MALQQQPEVSACAEYPERQLTPEQFETHEAFCFFCPSGQEITVQQHPSALSCVENPVLQITL